MTSNELGLGKLVNYGLSTTLHVPFNQFTKAAQQNNVPLSLLPLPQSPVGAFKRACTQIREDTKAADEPIIVKDIVSEQKHLCIRTFEKRIKSTEEDVKAMVEGKEYEPEYKPLVTIKYDRKTLDMTYTAYEENEGKEIFCRVLEYYNRRCGNANIQQFQQTIKNAYRQYGSIKLMRTGNSDFIPVCNYAGWENFSRFIRSFAGVLLQEFDICDNAANRQNLKMSLVADVEDSVEAEIKKLGKAQGSSDLASLIAEFGTALSNKQNSEKKLGKGALETMLTRYADTMKKVNLYRELLETDLSVIDSQISIAQEQVLNLMNSAA